MEIVDSMRDKIIEILEDWSWDIVDSAVASERGKLIAVRSASEVADDISALMPKLMDAHDLAVLFHDTYERLAPDFGYETRQETRRFDPETPNGRLMIAVCGQVLTVIMGIT